VTLTPDWEQAFHDRSSGWREKQLALRRRLQESSARAATFERRAAGDAMRC
jgi:hypothetical protein